MSANLRLDGELVGVARSTDIRIEKDVGIVLEIDLRKPEDHSPEYRPVVANARLEISVDTAMKIACLVPGVADLIDKA